MVNNKHAHIVLCVTNGLATDKRMLQTANTLVQLGAVVTLVGRQFGASVDTKKYPFELKRLSCFINHGPLFYLEFNIRLFFFLIGKKGLKVITSCDPDTMIGGILAGKVKGVECIYDAHEYFSEVPELINRPVVKNIWKVIESWGVHRVKTAYTVNASLANILSSLYGVTFKVVYNYPQKRLQKGINQRNIDKPLELFYQGVLNEGRGLEELVASLEHLPDVHLNVIGDGIMRTPLESMVAQRGLQNRVRFLGAVSPDKLYDVIEKFDISFNLLESNSLNYYYSTANKFFDAVQVLKPQVSMCFPEYVHLNAQYKVAVLIEKLTISEIVSAVEQLRDITYYNEIRAHCMEASKVWHWNENSSSLRDIYQL